jgi:hypothetical protein
MFQKKKSEDGKRLFGGVWREQRGYFVKRWWRDGRSEGQSGSDKRTSKRWRVVGAKLKASENGERTEIDLPTTATAISLRSTPPRRLSSPPASHTLMWSGTTSTCMAKKERRPTAEKGSSDSTHDSDGVFPLFLFYFFI